MSNAHAASDGPEQVDLADALLATEGWGDEYESGYADEYDDDAASAYDPETDGSLREGDPEELSAGDMDLVARHQLRRVAGLRTELEDITEVEYRQLRLERVVLVGVWTEGTEQDAENAMAELALLAETAGAEVLDAIYQRRQKPDPATYIGRGKVDAVREMVEANGADTVIMDGELGIKVKALWSTHVPSRVGRAPARGRTSFSVSGRRRGRSRCPRHPSPGRP
jgi:GTP-binding protein HflX